MTISTSILNDICSSERYAKLVNKYNKIFKSLKPLNEDFTILNTGIHGLALKGSHDYTFGFLPTIAEKYSDKLTVNNANFFLSSTALSKSKFEVFLSDITKIVQAPTTEEQVAIVELISNTVMECFLFEKF